MSNPSLVAPKISAGPWSDRVQATLDDWQRDGKTARMWNGDVTLWSGRDENKWIGWMNIVGQQQKQAGVFAEVAADVKGAGFRHVVLLGMGGSSLCPDVLQRTFGAAAGFPRLHIVDSMVPAQIMTVEKQIDIQQTLFIVSSKSGTTIEPNVLKQYFMDKVAQAVGADKAGSRFMAISDPGTKMEQIAKADHFRRTLFGLPTIGGRYSAMSNFGMVPAATIGMDVPAFLDRTQMMVEACSANMPAEKNPGVALGAILGTLTKLGRDKVTVISSPGIASLGDWLEQLLAESLGKEGKGLIPVAEESLGPPSVYGDDRVFAYVRLDKEPSAEQDAAIAALEKAGQPVVRIGLSDRMELGQQFFQWEIATAVSGSILGVNPFDQPDVEAAKIAARKLTSAYEETLTLPAETAVLTEGGISLFADPKNAAALASAAKSKTVAGYLAAHLARIKTGEYFAINAYVEMNDANGAPLQAMRHAVRDSKRVATTLGYGPRFLHSTGQLHKGGPNNGVFLQITSDDVKDLPIPGQKFTFGILKRCQAQGDFEVLAERDRRLLRVHLGPDVKAGLVQLQKMVQGAL